MSPVEGMNPKRVAFFMTTTLVHPGGMEKYMRNTATHLAKSGSMKADIVTMDENFSDQVKKIVSIYYLKRRNKQDTQAAAKIIEGIRSDIGEAKYFTEPNIRALRRRLANYDVIYSKNEILEAFMLKLLVGYRHIPPVIFGCHTPIHYSLTSSAHSRLHNALYSGPIYKYLAKGVRKFHVLNSADEKCLKIVFPNVEIEKIVNPFDFQGFDIARSVQYPGSAIMSQSKFNVLWVGRLTEQKGVDDLIRLVRYANSNGLRNRIQWNIVGIGPDKKKIEMLAGAEPNVAYLGAVDGQYMPAIYGQNQAFVSTSHWEGFPYTLIEAQAAGLPIICFNVDGCRDIVDDGFNGLLAADVEGLYRHMIYLVNGGRVTSDIKQHIRERFDSDKIYGQLTSMLTSVD